jgi:hypothetical protein
MTLVTWKVSHPIVLSYWTRLAAWCRTFRSHRHYSHDQGWSTACGGWRYTIAAYPHIMPALMVTASLVRHVRSLPTTATLSCACVLRIREPSWTSSKARGPQRVMGHVITPEPSSTERRGLEPQDACQYQSPPQWEGGSEVVRHVTTPKPFLTGRQGLELRNMWQRRSPPRQGGEIQSCETRDSVRVLLNREARSEATWHVTARDNIPYVLS